MGLRFPLGAPRGRVIAAGVQADAPAVSAQSPPGGAAHTSAERAVASAWPSPGIVAVAQLLYHSGGREEGHRFSPVSPNR